MSNRLIDRQLSLLEYLTSGAAIFGSPCVNADHTCSGIESGLLDREARFSFDKRMGKVRAVLPLTVALIENNGIAVLQEFVEACPPKDIGQFANALQFSDFLRAHARRAPLAPPYVVDVAACELALARVRSRIDEPRPMAESCGRHGAIRRHPDAVFVSCTYDVRSVFEVTGEPSPPEERNTFVAVSIPQGAEAPQLFEMNAVLFDLLSSCHMWADLSVFGATGEREDLVHDLVNSGLVEVR